MDCIDTWGAGDGVWLFWRQSVDGSVSVKIGVSEQPCVEIAVSVLGEERFLSLGEVEGG